MNPKRKFFLFKQSAHFCSVPWNHFEVFSNGDIKTCSKGHKFGNINQEPLEQILGNNQIKSIKNNLLADKLDNNCIGCHQLTTNNEHFDLRNYYNPMFKSVDINYDNVDAFELHGIDLHWDNTCNFKCVYCNPQQSSLIAQEQNIPVNKLDSTNIDKIISMIVKNQHELKEIYLSGGEPLLIKHNFKLLSQISNKDVLIRINSNISVANEKNLVFSELKKFKNVLWTISADTMGEKFNYIRSGGDWNVFIKNLNNITKLRHGIRLNLVWFVGSAQSIFDTIEFFIKQYGIKDITINQLFGHPSLQVRNSPDLVKRSAKEKLNKLLESGLVDFKSNSWFNIARCSKELELPIEDPIGYMEYFKELDQLRNTNWREIFPELA
jgi:radical SAM protein with 4Fe4S-binding SPASM domain